MPTVLIATEEFAALAAAEREALGLPGLPLVLVAHPFGDQPATAIAKRATAAVLGIAAGLTRQASALAEEEYARELPRPRSGIRSRPVFASESAGRDRGPSRG